MMERWLKFWIKFPKCRWSWIDQKHPRRNEIQFEYGSSLSPPSCNTLTYFLPLAKAIKSQPWLFATLRYIQNLLTYLNMQIFSKFVPKYKHRKTWNIKLFRFFSDSLCFKYIADYCSKHSNWFFLCHTTFFLKEDHQIEHMHRPPLKKSVMCYILWNIWDHKIK